MTTIEAELKWFEYRQNNSGGSFTYDPQNGISVNVYIQAQDAREADYKAEAIGLYWDGCQSGMDCDCCGDRWYPQNRYWGDGDPVDEVPGPDEPFDEEQHWHKWIDGYETFVHRYDGSFYGTHK